MNKKIEFAVAQYMLDFCPEYKSDWGSSSQNLENALRAKGIKLPQKLFYKYNLPDGVAASDYQKFLDRFKLGHFDVTEEKQRLELVIGGEFYDLYSKFSNEEKQMFFDVLTKKAQKQKKLIEQDCLKLRKLNPELATLDVSNNIDLLYGATFGFAPDEIAHFHNLKEMKLDWKQNFQEKAKQNMLEKQLDIPVTYRLAPKTIDMILAAAQKLEK